MRTVRTTPVPKLWLATTGLLIAACATAPPGQKDLLAFLADGKTTRAEVVQREAEVQRSHKWSAMVARRQA